MPPKTQAPPKKTEEKKEQPKAAAPKKEEPKKAAAPAPAKKEETKKAAAPAPAKKEEPKKAAAPAKKEEPKKAAAPAKKEESKKAVAAAPAKKEAKPAAKTATKTATKTASKSEGKRKAEASTQAAKKQKTEKPASTKIAGSKAARNFSVGNDIQPKRDLTRFVKWPKYILMQRQRRVLQHRLKVPPSINQFTKTLDTNQAANLFKLLNKYRPEDSAAKAKRLMKIAAGKARVKKEKPITVKSGINHITKLVEDKKAALVVIAHDVDPIELVLYLPALCRKQGIPYCFVKGKARLGQLVHRKTATAIALKSVKNDDRAEFSQLLQTIRANYNDKYEEMKKKWGGGVMGLKSQAVTKQREKLKKQEDKKKAIKFK